MIEIRPATVQDMHDFYGRLPPVSVKAMAVIKDGIVRCIAGVTIERDQMIAFSDMKDDGTPRATRMRIARELVEWMRDMHPVVTLTPEQMKSDKLLRKLGFLHCGTHKDINIYRL